MAKEITEELENVFEGFNFLNDSIPKSASKKDKTTPKTETIEVSEGDELTDEDLAALEASKKEFENKKKSTSTKKEEVESGETPEEAEEIVEDKDVNEFKGFATFLSEEGVIDLEDTDEFKSEKDLAKVVQRTIKNGISNDRARLPEDGQKFLEFIDAGGKPSDFHTYYYGDASFEDFDITSEENQKHVIREALKLEEYTDEEIEETLVDFEDTGKTDKKAEMYLKKLQKVEKTNKALLLETQKAYAKEQEQARIQEWDTFKKGLFEKDTIGGFKMTPKMKEDTWTYMTKIVDKKTGESQMQIDDRENKDARYIYAYLLKNKWDVKSLEKQVETKQVSKLRDTLSNYSDTRGKLKSPKNNLRDTETDESNPFTGFTKAFK